MLNIVKFYAKYYIFWTKHYNLIKPTENYIITAYPSFLHIKLIILFQYSNFDLHQFSNSILVSKLVTINRKSWITNHYKYS